MKKTSLHHAGNPIPESKKIMVFNHYKANPNQTLKQIGAQYDMSYLAVSQILTKKLCKQK